MPQNITCAEFFSYCRGLGLQGTDFLEYLLDLIQEMDQVFVEHVISKAQETTADKGAKPDVVSKGPAKR